MSLRVSQITRTSGRSWHSGKKSQVGQKNFQVKYIYWVRWNVAGGLPDEIPFLYAASVDIHYTQQGSFWPVGGASEASLPFSDFIMILINSQITVIDSFQHDTRH